MHYNEMAANEQIVDLHIGINTLEKLPEILSKYKNRTIAVVYDIVLAAEKVIYTQQLKNILNSTNSFGIVGGIESKNIESFVKLVGWLDSIQMPRDGIIVAIGGGVIGDLCAFTASTYQRGIDIIHVPTTTTSMIDSCIGGKTGINFNGRINAIGTYHNPIGIIIDTKFLSSLSRRDLKSGICEAIKMAIISDKPMCDMLKESDLEKCITNKEWMIEIVKWSIETKVEYTSADMKEKSERLKLNYGHTFGQAIESFFGTDGSVIRHGEAVSLGLIIAAHLSNYTYKTKETEKLLEFTKEVLRAHELPIRLKEIQKSSIVTADTFMQKIYLDKKRDSKGNKFILSSSIGTAEVVRPQMVEKHLEKSFSAIL